MTLPVQPAPHVASGRCISLGEDNVASPRAYPGDLVYDFARMMRHPSDRDLFDHLLGLPVQNDHLTSGYHVLGKCLLAVPGEIQPAQSLGDRDASDDRLGGGVKLIDSTILHVREVEHLSVKQERRLLWP